MKKFNFLVIFLCFLSIFAFSGCGSKTLDAASIVRDDARTGGSLSFVYDKNTQTVYVGGENEVVQFSSENEAKGLSEGCRIGLKVTAPDESLNLDTATLEMNGVNYASGNFLEMIDGQKQRFFNLYPLVSPEDDVVKFSVTWQEGTKQQDYKIIMVSGTKYMQKDGSII